MAMMFVPFLDLFKKTVVSHVTMQALQELGKVLDKKHLVSHEERNAMIEYWFHYDQEYQLLKIQLALDKAVQHLETQFGAGIAQLDTALTYRKIDEGIYLVCHALQAYFQADPASRDHQKNDFLRVFERQDPKDLLTLLHKHVTVNDAAGQFLHTLMKSCNYHAYEHWCDHIAITALRAYLSCMHQLNIIHDDLMSQVLMRPQTVQMKVNIMVNQVEEILKTLQESKDGSRGRIFHGAENNQSELMDLVDKFMLHCEEEPMSHNQHCAEKLGEELSEKYPWYSWAVILAEDSSRRPNFIMYSDDFQDDLFIQRSLHSQIFPYIASSVANRPQHDIILNGKKFGMMVVKKRVHVAGKMASRRRLIVLWTKPEDVVFLGSDAKELLQDVDVKDLLPGSKEDCIREQKKAWDVKQSVMENILYEDQMQYVACIGIAGERPQGELGVFVKASADGVSSWPERVQNKTGQLFLWATKVTSKGLEFRARRSCMSLYSLISGLVPMANALTDSSVGTKAGNRDDILIELADDSASNASAGIASPADRISPDDLVSGGTVRSRVDFFERRPNVQAYQFSKAPK
ncbi:uncharacterized protein LOC129592419 [Paramacrobiotus metropolitanus]|uniref:uncharacterized protein LOC129592419 n=1 Tax=Paramacrobiotus metropolitanus TaxID=2943436 RepID=UPI00244571C5|nr:uncharacterized protein LOC129592419 [Paramacrobiotus metropolitanus]